MMSMGGTPKACKASKNADGGSSSTSNGSPSCSSNKKKYSGGNPIHPRETPSWQKTITCFFSQKDNDEGSPPPSTDGDDESLIQQNVINYQAGSSKE